MTEAALAATVVLGREAEAGFTVLMMQRAHRGIFAGAWVFPGGRIDDTDAPGEPHDVRARAGAVREVHEEVGLNVDPAALVPLSRWIPPAEIGRRFDTDFYLAHAPDAKVVPNPAEVVTWQWLSPRSALERHASGDFELPPPTFVTLTRLSRHESFAAAMTDARTAGQRVFATRGIPSRGTVLWDGDELVTADGLLEPDAETADGPRHRLLTRELPWTYIER